MVLRGSAGRAALEALQPEPAALLRAYTGGCILGVNVTTAGALSAWSMPMHSFSLLSAALLAKLQKQTKQLC